jgi:hypothetical protein
MYNLAPASFVVFTLVVAGVAFSQDNESSVFQMPSESASQAFVEQLPESVVVPVPGTPLPSQKTPKAMPKPRVAKRAIAIHSIFPNVGAGVNARADAGQPSVQLPTVGGGVTQSL